MKVSTRGRYALRVMIDLAEHNSENYIPLKDIVDRQEISQKYLEGIMTDLAKSGMLCELVTGESNFAGSTTGAMLLDCSNVIPKTSRVSSKSGS